MSKSFIPPAVLASLAAIALVNFSAPVSARVILTACQAKHSKCSEHCIIRNVGDKIDACIKRTCDKQHPGCGPSSLQTGGKVALPPGSPPKDNVRVPLGAGILETSTGFSSQVPAATGTPVKILPAPPVIIR